MTVGVAAAGALAVPGLGAAFGEGPSPGPIAEILRERLGSAGADAVIREGVERLCLEEGKHWDDARRECVYLMRSKD